jgi:hypothetical protein
LFQIDVDEKGNEIAFLERPNGDHA